MTDRTPPSRRTLLAAFATAGTAGFLGGVGANATLNDEETVRAAVRAGTTELTVETMDANDPAGHAENDTAVVPLEDVSAGDGGWFGTHLRACDAPLDVGVRVVPESGTDSDLAGALRSEVTLDYPDATESVFDGSVDGLVDALSERRPLARCVTCESTVLSLSWWLPEGATVPTAETVAFAFDFAAARCAPGQSASTGTAAPTDTNSTDQ